MRGVIGTGYSSLAHEWHREVQDVEALGTAKRDESNPVIGLCENRGVHWRARQRSI